MMSRNTPTELPRDLVDRIGVFERRLRRMEAVLAALAALAGVLGAYAVLFLLDRVWETPPLGRWLTLAAGLATLLAGAAFWVQRWILRRRDDRALARLVQRYHRGLGDRLLGAVELGDSASVQASVSPALRRAALRQVAEEARRYDFRAAVPRRGARRIGVASAVLAATVGLAVTLAPEAGRVTFRRWLFPASSLARYTFARFQPLPSERIVPRGEPFSVGVEMAPHARWRPALLRARLGGTPAVTAPFEDGRALALMPGVLAPGTLHLSAGDAFAHLRVVPVQRSELLAWSVRIHPPAYLLRPPYEGAVRSGRVDVPEGARVDLSGRVNRRLHSAQLLEPREETLPVGENRFSIDAIASGRAGESPRVLRFTWIDAHGLEGAAPARLGVQAVTDDPPRLFTEGLSPFHAVLRDEVLTLRVRATDDFGLRSLWIERQTGGDEPVALELAEGHPEALSIEGVYAFNAALLEIPDDTRVELAALTADYRPDAGPVRSPTFRIFVMSAERHAEELRLRHERLQARLESILHATEAQVLRHEGMEALEEERLAGSAASAELARSEQAERELVRNLRDLADAYRELALEGLRNPKMDAEMIDAWSSLALMAQSVGEVSLAAAAQALARAAEQASESAARRASIGEALDREREALAQLRETDRRSAEAMEMILARGFVRRLRTLAQFESGVARGVAQDLPRTIGLPAEDLADRERDRLIEWSARQEHALSDTRGVMDDLAGFARRTGDPRYTAVRDAMIEADVERGLAALARQVLRNLGVAVIEGSQEWAAAFEAWASALEDDGAEDGSGGDGGGGGDEGLDLETVIALMRTAVRQESLREQVRLVEQETSGSVPEKGPLIALAGRQGEVGTALRGISSGVEDGRVRSFVDALAGVSDEAMGLLKQARVDGETRAAQTEIVERIAALLGGGQGESEESGQGGISEALQSLLAMMMGGGMGGAGGGEAAGTGAESPLRVHLPGVGEGVPGSTGGHDPGTWPAEYREMLQAFFGAEGSP